MAQKNQTRIFLWAVPRSISTAFFRSMMNKSNCKTILEPFSQAYYFGEERVSGRYAGRPVQPQNTFRDVQTLCEMDYPGYETVFVKDMAYYLTGKLDSLDYIPANYIHTFLLRKPEKSIYSLYKMSLNKELTGWDHFDPNEIGFRELYEMFTLVTTQLGQKAIVVDADDLLKHPESVFRLYCSKVGIEFEDRLLNWDECPQDLEPFQSWMPWFEGVLTTKTFQSTSTGAAKSPVVETPDLPGHVLKAIEDNAYYYDQMQAFRLRPDELLIQ